MPTTPRVLILGGGFGGLLAAQAFRGAAVDVTLVDKRNFHLFQPLLYQVATGSLAPGEVAAPLRGILSSQKNTRVLLAEAADLDPVGRSITLADGGALPYDYLIVSTGSRTSYFGNDHWRQYAPSLKTLEEATAIRHKILYAFEAAEREPDAAVRRAWLTFVIIGAGPTGVEMAGAIAEIARHTLKNDFRSIHPEEAQILLLDAAPRVLNNYPADLSPRAEAALLKLGVRTRTGCHVTEIDAEGVTFRSEGNESRIASRTVLWAGGVMPTHFTQTLATRLGVALDRAGRIQVNADLTVAGHENIYVVGDMALLNREDGRPLPGVSQVAMQEGRHASRSILRRLKGQNTLPFRYFDRGDMAVIGRKSAVANLFGWHVSGVVAWLVWLLIHLMYLVEFQSRIVVFIRWGIQYLTFSRGSRLITGDRDGKD